MKRQVIGILVLCSTIFASVYYIGYLCYFWSEITSSWFGIPTAFVIGMILFILGCIGVALTED